jgi:hypothetical protein
VHHWSRGEWYVDAGAWLFNRVLSIIAGGTFGMKYLEEGSVIAAFEDIFKPS